MNTSKKSSDIARIELYLDDETKPFQVLEKQPFQVRLDTQRLADGRHILRIVRVHRDGSMDEKRQSFTVDNLPSLTVDGLDEESPVHGELSFEILGGIPSQQTPSRVPLILYAGITGVVLFTVWAFFALSPRAELVLQSVEPKKSTNTATTGPNLSKIGEEIYTTSCSGCHLADGKGVPNAIPQLAGNPNLKDENSVISAIVKGVSGPLKVGDQSFNGQMPPFSQLSDEEIAAVTNHIRNSWGNKFGQVDVTKVKSHR